MRRYILQDKKESKINQLELKTYFSFHFITFNSREPSMMIQLSRLDLIYKFVPETNQELK